MVIKDTLDGLRVAILVADGFEEAVLLGGSDAAIDQVLYNLMRRGIEWNRIHGFGSTGCLHGLFAVPSGEAPA